MIHGFLFAFSLTILAANPNFHNEVVGDVQIDQTGKTLTVIAVLDKRYLALGLKKDADCRPQEMMSVCAGEYFLQNLQLTADGKSIELKKVDQRLEQSSVVITYQTSMKETIKKLDVMSSYLFHLNSHALIRLQLSVDGAIKHYQLNTSKPSITANF
ncbi:MAG: hypothetical protein GC178_10475 [Flavobacteriales bacterium]|nr:hypothetical protein [Flavobacteriales bacterium]